MAAKAALEYVVEGEYLGVGTGTTVGFFITELATSGKKSKRLRFQLGSNNPSASRLRHSCL